MPSVVETSVTLVSVGILNKYMLMIGYKKPSEGGTIISFSLDTDENTEAVGTLYPVYIHTTDNMSDSQTLQVVSK